MEICKIMEVQEASMEVQEESVQNKSLSLSHWAKAYVEAWNGPCEFPINLISKNIQN